MRFTLNSWALRRRYAVYFWNSAPLYPFLPLQPKKVQITRHGAEVCQQSDEYSPFESRLSRKDNCTEVFAQIERGLKRGL